MHKVSCERNMATSSLLSAPFDARRDKIALYFERFNSRCKVLGIDELKRIDQLIASLDTELYEKLKIAISPQYIL